MIRLTWFAAVTFVIASSASAQTWEQVWADEFDGSTLDAGKWTAQLGDGCPDLCGWGNNELEWYQAANATVEDGMLTITAREESVGGKNYTSARLRTIGKGDWTYGRMEARARLPIGKGLWPAIWMLPTEPSIYGTWAASGEIDIMEYVGDKPAEVLGTLHYGGTFPANQSSTRTYTLPSGTFADDFHVFAVEWEAGAIRWYVDDELYATQTSWSSSGGAYPAPFDVDFHLILNLAVGGNLPGNPDGTTTFPQAMVVDYVRVYKDVSEPVDPPVSLVFDDMEHGNPLGNGWFAFGGSVGGGGIDANAVDVPATGGGFSLQAGFGGAAGFIGGFGRTKPMDLTGATEFRFWIKPDAGQAYTLEINLQDDDNGDNLIPSPSSVDDEYQFSCVVGASGPCAVAGGGWQEVVIPFSSFVDDNSFNTGGNGVFDPVAVAAGGNGQLVAIVVAVIGTGTDATFRTDNWAFVDPTATSVSEDAELPAQAFTYAVYPNPFAGSGALQVTAKRSHHVQVDVFDLLGRKMEQLFEGVLAAGETRSLTIDGSAWPAGVYVYRIAGEGHIATGRFVVSR